MILLQFNKKPPNNYKIEENLKKTAALLRNGFLKLPKISVSPEVRQPYDVWRSSIKKQIHETNFFHHECLARCLENTGKVIKNVIILCSKFYELSKWAFNSYST